MVPGVGSPVEDVVHVAHGDPAVLHRSAQGRGVDRPDAGDPRLDQGSDVVGEVSVLTAPLIAEASVAVSSSRIGRPSAVLVATGRAPSAVTRISP